MEISTNEIQEEVKIGNFKISQKITHKNNNTNKNFINSKNIFYKLFTNFNFKQ